MVTLVVAGIFFLLLMNSNPDSFGITSLAISNLGEKEMSPEEEVLSYDIPLDKSEVDMAFDKEVQKNTNEVDFILSFDQIPSVSKEARIKEMVLTFDDLTTNIKVGDDKLELNNLKEVSLKIQGFAGEVNFDENDFSVNGLAKSIEVNGVKLSTKEEIKISFEGLNYKTVAIEDIELLDLELPRGDGELKVSEKLKYGLEQDQVKIYYFNGKLSAQMEPETNLELEGVVKGIKISGALLNLNLR